MYEARISNVLYHNYRMEWAPNINGLGQVCCTLFISMFQWLKEKYFKQMNPPTLLYLPRLLWAAPKVFCWRKERPSLGGNHVREHATVVAEIYLLQVTPVEKTHRIIHGQYKN